MTTPPSHPFATASRRPLAACIAALCGLSAPAAIAATTWPVTSCDDTGPGTLRFVVEGLAASGDTVDMTTLSCPHSVISLQTGAIFVTEDSLTIKGPGASKLVITGKYNGTENHDRIFYHPYMGTLSISDLTIEYGLANDSTVQGPNGGCILSTGNVNLDHVNLRYCVADSVSGAANGGAVALAGFGKLTLKYSTITTNAAHSASGYAFGGGALAPNIEAVYSTVSNNYALAPSGALNALGGALFTAGNVKLYSSTVSSNYSSGSAAGLFARGISGNVNKFVIASSTISGNTAAGLVGGAFSNAATVQLYNSTIAFNSATTGRLGASMPFYYYSPGLTLSGSEVAISATLRSSLLSNNTYGTSEDDLSTTRTSSHPITFNIGPAYNLVRAPRASGLPSGTITVACPRLGRLRDNGGLTQTQALLSHSIAIDAGDDNGLIYDQRGPPYARVSGAAADIGAYEVNQDDIVFNADFEDCPLLVF